MMPDQLNANPWTLAWIGVLLVVVVFAVPLIRTLLNRTALSRYRVPVVVDRVANSLRVLVLVIGARIILYSVDKRDASWFSPANHVLQIAMIAAIIWLLCEIVIAVEELILNQFMTDLTGDDVPLRRAKTQITLLRRLVIVVLVFIGGAAILTTFPSVNLLGRSVLASAGFLSIVAGLAAQTSLTNVFAGIQLAVSNALRVGDVVAIEDESGVVTDITLTYVVIGLWDDRKLILPSSWFISQPFENWTRSGDQIGGTVFVDVEWTVPIAEMRAALTRALEETPLWDRRSASLNVADTQGGRVTIRIDLTAADASSLFGLKSYVREQMVNFVANQGSGSLPVVRFEQVGGDRGPIGPARPPGRDLR